MTGCKDEAPSLPSRSSFFGCRLPPIWGSSAPSTAAMLGLAAGPRPTARRTPGLGSGHVWLSPMAGVEWQSGDAQMRRASRQEWRHHVKVRPLLGRVLRGVALGVSPSGCRLKKAVGLRGSHGP